MAYCQPNPGYGYAPSCMDDMDECPNHPDLYLLRDAAADERGAIADYLACALDTCLDIFLHIAEDEMQHYVAIMRLISLFDPVQAKMLKEEDLDFLVFKRAPNSKPKWSAAALAEPAAEVCADEEEEEVKVTPPGRKDITAIRCLTKGLQDELLAINKYQKYMNQAKDHRVQALFCELMNDEKEHVAELTAALFKLTHEPLTEEK